MFEVIFKRGTARHDSCEFHIIHDIAAGVSSEVLFNHISRDPADTGRQASQSGSILDHFQELVVRHGIKKAFLLIK